jgi:hypothetical protein
LDRVNHVKIVTPDPDAIDRSLGEVLELFAAGWPLGEGSAPAGIPCTKPAVTPWGEGGRAFSFAEVGGIVETAQK